MKMIPGSSSFDNEAYAFAKEAVAPCIHLTTKLEKKGKEKKNVEPSNHFMREFCKIQMES